MIIIAFAKQNLSKIYILSKIKVGLLALTNSLSVYEDKNAVWMKERNWELAVTFHLHNQVCKCLGRIKTFRLIY